MSEWQAIGAHRYRIADGILWMDTNGGFTSEQAQLIVSLITAWQQKEDACGALINVRGGVGVPADARRIVAQRARQAELPLPVAVVGAGATARAVLTLMLNAIRLVRKHEVPLAFCRDEAEAVQWLQPRIKEREEGLRVLRAAARKK